MSIFKKRILELVRPPKRETFNISDRQGLKRLFQLRVGLSPLKSHKHNHNFNDIINDTCSCGLGSETSQHFLTQCPNYNLIRIDLLEKVKTILRTNDINFDATNLVHLLLYGHNDLNHSDNRKILEYTIKFIAHSGRLN